MQTRKNNPTLKKSDMIQNSYCGIAGYKYLFLWTVRSSKTLGHYYQATSCYITE